MGFDEDEGFLVCHCLLHMCCDHSEAPQQCVYLFSEEQACMAVVLRTGAPPAVNSHATLPSVQDFVFSTVFFTFVFMLVGVHAGCNGAVQGAQIMA